MKKYKLIPIVLALVLTLTAILGSVALHAKPYFYPEYEKLSLESIFEKESLDEDDYKTLFLQTGLGKYAIDSIFGQEHFRETVLFYQNQFFDEKEYSCKRKAVITGVEVSEEKTLFAVKSGYVIITSATHSFFWRHGHAGLVLDEDTVLEAPILSKPAGTYKLEEWSKYPSFIILRLKDAQDSFLSETAYKAQRKLMGMKYDPLAAVFNKEKAKRVQCAYLVWRAFYEMGVDVDEGGNNIVTVNDIKNSDSFEIVQVYGYDPLKLL